MDGFESFLDNIIYDNQLYHQDRYSDSIIHQKVYEGHGDQFEFGKYSQLFKLNWREK